MTDLWNHVSKQQLHFVVLITVITPENFTLRTFGLLPPNAFGRLLLCISASLLENELNKEGIVQPGHAAISKQTKSSNSTD